MTKFITEESMGRLIGIVKGELARKAASSELHSHSNKTVLDGITSDKVTEWDNKSTFSGSYNDLTNKPTIPTKTSQLTNDSDFATNAALTSGLASKADKTELHSHSNKTVLDGITSAKVTEWNNKSTFSGSYNDLTNKPTIPTKTSQLTNDSDFATNASVTSGLAGKANTSHTHAISEVTNLQTTLDAKALKTELHEHANKTVLDSITVSTADGGEMWNTIYNNTTV